MRSLKRLSVFFSSINEWVGRIVSWFTLALVLCTVWDVLLRYFFKAGSIKIQELEWHFFSIIFLLAAGYTFKHNEQVRVDIFYARMKTKTKALINAVGAILFLIPFCLIVIHASLPFVLFSYQILETSADPGGLPYRFLIKSAIPLGFLFLFLQGLASFFDNLLILFSGEKVD